MSIELEKRISVLEDKLALQELTHGYLAAADRKDSNAMASYFTPTGSLTSIMPNQTIILETRDKIANGFSQILRPITVAYHMAGQLATTVSGDTAEGISYCFVTLAVSENDEQYVRKIWAVYKDEYVKSNANWLISKRVATVAWEEREAIK